MSAVVRSAVGAALLGGLAVILANAALRPGCSLLPVSVPAEDRAMPLTYAQACAVLGQPVPLPRELPAGYRVIDLTGGAARELAPGLWTSGQVHVAYGRDQVRMTITYARGRSAPPDAAAVVRLGPHGVQVGEARLPDGTLDRSYIFERGAVLITAHIAIEADVTADVADRVIASVP